MIITLVMIRSAASLWWSDNNPAPWSPSYVEAMQRNERLEENSFLISLLDKGFLYLIHFVGHLSNPFVQTGYTGWADGH